MHETTEVLRLLLAAVLAVASVAKLADRAGARAAMRSFGVPAALAGPLAVGVPVLEATIAVSLVPASLARFAAAVAAVLFIAFAVVVAIARLRGRTPECHCFGRIHSAPAGWGVVVRNLALLALAGVVATAPAAPIGTRSLVAFAAIAAFGGQALLWIALLRRYGRALRRIDELEAGAERAVLEPGDAAPEFTLPSLDGEALSLRDLLAGGRPVLLVFTDTRCGACTALYPMLSRWQEELGHALSIAILATGRSEELRALAEEHELEHVLVADHAALQAFGLEAAPGAVVIGLDGRLASSTQYGALDIEALALDAAEPAAFEVAVNV